MWDPGITGLWRAFNAALLEEDSETALQVAAAAVEHYKLTDRRHAAIWQRKIAGVLYERSQFKEAIATALESVELTSDGYEQSLSLIMCAIAAYSAKQYAAAESFLHRADSVAGGIQGEFGKDLYLWGHWFGVRANLHYARGRFDEAIIAYDGAAALMLDRNEERRAANYMNNAALVFIEKGDYENAEQYLTSALRLLEQQPHTATKASIFDTLGQLYSLTGRDFSARRYLNEAIRRFKKLDEQVRAGESILNLSRHYKMTGSITRARELAEEANRLGSMANSESLVAAANEELRRLEQIRVLRQETTA